MIALLLHIFAGMAIALASLLACRWIFTQSRTLGILVAVTIAVRIVAGVGLFLISSLHLPIAPALQSGGGFWMFAQDARGYYELAGKAAADHTLYPLDHAVPSPFYVDALAAWMMAVGTSPVAAVFLNLLLYVAFATAMVRAFEPVNDWRRDLPCIVGLGAYSLSPAVIFHSTQPLKEECSAIIVGLAVLAILALTPYLRRGGRREARAFGWATLGLAVTIVGAAGIRWYFAFIMWGVLAITLVTTALRGRRLPIRRYAPAALALLAATWIGFWLGAGPYYGVVGGPSTLNGVIHLVELPTQLLVRVQLGRTGFLTSGGDTNVVVPLRKETKAGEEHVDQLIARERADDRAKLADGTIPAQPPPQATAVPAPETASTAATAAAPLSVAAPPPDATAAMQAVPVTMVDHVRTAIDGLAILFVPITVLRHLTAIQVSGGRGFLPLVDLDTVFLDIVTLTIVVLMWQRRGELAPHAPMLVFALLLSAISAVLVGYVITNFGTLWRMRTLVAVPLWVLVTALSPQPNDRHLA